jgi:hypothetical protein
MTTEDQEILTLLKKLSPLELKKYDLDRDDVLYLEEILPMHLFSVQIDRTITAEAIVMATNEIEAKQVARDFQSDIIDDYRDPDEYCDVRVSLINKPENLDSGLSSDPPYAEKETELSCQDIVDLKEKFVKVASKSKDHPGQLYLDLGI